jgi:hypothetical protein
MRPIHAFALAVAVWILGGAIPEVEARGALRLTVTTTPAPNGTYSPRNAVAVWVQTQGGVFVKTVGQWVSIRQPYLVAWRQAAGATDIDAVIGASRVNHAEPLTLVWNLRDRQGNPVPDGTYTIRLELAEGNSTAAGQNNQGTFTFVKGPSPQTQMNLANGGFTNVSIVFDPSSVTCGDGLVDGPDEKCDFMIRAGMPGACPASCETTDTCAPAELEGIPELCSAECVPGPRITACVDGDRCCPAGCSEAEDVD